MERPQPFLMSGEKQTHFVLDSSRTFVLFSI